MAEANEKQYSILMTRSLAQMTYNGSKTKTRRPLKTLPGEDFCAINGLGNPVFTANQKKYREVTNRYGDIGTHLAVKEFYFAYGYWKTEGLTKTGLPKKHFVDLTAAKFEITNGEYRYVTASEEDVRPLRRGMTGDIGWYQRPGIFMPRRAARSIVEITDLRVERVQDISDDDAIAEGISKFSGDPRSRFEKLWNDINQKRGFGWDVNPWVLAITYKKING